MSYFFTHFLQTILPISLLLSGMWAKYHSVNLTKLARLTVLAILIGYALSYLPPQQIILLNRNIVIALSLILFVISQFFTNKSINYILHWLLLSLAFVIWFNDPNISAMTSTAVINTDLILHIFAILVAAVFCLMVSIWLYCLLIHIKTIRKSTALSSGLILLIGLIVLIGLLLLPTSGEILLNLIKLQILELSKSNLTFVAKTTNMISWNNYICSFLLLITAIYPLTLYYFKSKVQIKQLNDIISKRQAQRKLQQTRRLILWGIMLSIITLVSQLYWDKIASRPPQLSTAQPVHLTADNQVHIPIEQVKDGKLHRFLWVSDEGKAVRFFIINRLADRLSLAVVFDACLLCGDQGYIMQGNQVICIGCGVYMFTPSIGKAGGCNPVPIEDWQQTEQEVIISKSSLEAGLMLFSTIIEMDVVDPVDHSLLKNTKTEYKYSYGGKTYFFANQQNLEKFRSNPQQFIHNEE